MIIVERYGNSLSEENLRAFSFEYKEGVGKRSKSIFLSGKFVLAKKEGLLYICVWETDINKQPSHVIVANDLANVGYGFVGAGSATWKPKNGVYYPSCAFYSESCVKSLGVDRPAELSEQEQMLNEIKTVMSETRDKNRKEIT